VTDQPLRVEWGELRPSEGLFLIIAERDANIWRFWERESWEVTWGEIPSSLTLIAKADELARNSNDEYKAGPPSTIPRPERPRGPVRTFSSRALAAGGTRFVEIASPRTNRGGMSCAQQPGDGLFVRVVYEGSAPKATKASGSSGDQCVD